jgi:plastocyanin
MRQLRTVLSAVLVLMAAKAGVAYNPKLIALNAGQSCTDSFGGNVEHTVRVIAVDEFFEQGYWQGAFRNICYKALITVEVDGVRGEVGCGPFYMPVVVNGLRICGEVTKAFSGSTAIAAMNEDVLLSVKDASLPWYAPGSFVFPIENYRWGASPFQNAWLGFHDMSGGKLYYHYGVDLGGLHPNYLKLVSMVNNGRITQWGVGTRIVSDALELDIRYYHMVEQYMRTDIGVGSVLDQGEMFGYLGNNGTGSDAHVHIDVRYTNGDPRHVNNFPMIVQAHLEQYGEPISFPGHKRHTFVGQPIELDGTLSVAPAGEEIVSYQWTFTDGSTATTPKVARTYATRGTYSEGLTVTSSTGKRSTNFVMVFVYPESGAVDAPYVHAINHSPIRGIQAGDTVSIRVNTRNITSNMSLAFGDGTGTGGIGTTGKHVYTQPGEYTLVFQGDGPGGHGIFKSVIIVEGETSAAPAKNVPKRAVDKRSGPRTQLDRGRMSPRATTYDPSGRRIDPRAKAEGRAAYAPGAVVVVVPQ